MIEFDLVWAQHFEGSAFLRFVVQFLHRYALQFHNDSNIYKNQELYLEIILSSWERTGNHVLRFRAWPATGAWYSDTKRRIWSLCEWSSLNTIRCIVSSDGIFYAKWLWFMVINRYPNMCQNERGKQHKKFSSFSFQEKCKWYVLVRGLPFISNTRI
jgi:hypothetical protein